METARITGHEVDTLYRFYVGKTVDEPELADL